MSQERRTPDESDEPPDRTTTPDGAPAARDVLAHPVRRDVLAYLLANDGESGLVLLVNEVARRKADRLTLPPGEPAMADVRRALLGHHLPVLSAAGLLTRHADAERVSLRASPGAVREALESTEPRAVGDRSAGDRPADDRDA